MADNHDASDAKVVNLASRATPAEAFALTRTYNFEMKDMGEHVGEKGNTFGLRYFHKATGLWYRAFASWSEMRDDSTRNFPEVIADILKWATLEKEDLSGRFLGRSGRIDGLQGCDISKTMVVEDEQSAATNDLALVLWHPDGLGAMRKIPKELRCEIYQHAFPRTFWQCYHTKQAGLSLLDMTHSSRLPGIFNVSKIIREEVFDSAYSSRSLEIVVGADVIAVNFPLLAGIIEAGQVVEGTQAKIPFSADMLIGIQVPSPRCVVETSKVRINVARVVDLLNSIAAAQSLPAIRVSFKTNDDTASLQYYRSDFEVFAGPFSKLRVARTNPDMRVRLPFRIDRLRPYSSSDGRDETCGLIELAIRDPKADVAQLTYRQHMIDLKLDLAAHKRCKSTGEGGTLSLPASSPRYSPAAERVFMASKELVAFYEARSLVPPQWIRAICETSRQRESAAQATDARVLDDIVSGAPEMCGSDVESWVNGYSSTTNPFWYEGQSQFWQ